MGRAHLYHQGSPGGEREAIVEQAIRAVLRRRELSATERLLLLILLAQANEEGLVEASVSRLAQDLGRTERATQLALRRLEARGLVERLERPGRANVYRIPLERLGEGVVP